MNEIVETHEALNFFCATPPAICPDCAIAMFKNALADEKLGEVFIHCPHLHVLIHAQIGKNGDQRGIIRWIIEGPVSEEDSVKIITELGKRSGQEPYLLNGPNAVN